MNTEELDLTIEPASGAVDQWIISKSHRMITDARYALETYRFDIYANTVYEFAWHEYCDWYLELSKPLLWNQDADPAARTATQRTLLQVSIEQEEEADIAFSTLMGEAVEERRDFIQKNALLVANLDI